ncbi:hypothetical protein [Arthrobacter sp. KK5.5]|uniref:hypothetical protein n=1 Tax=Arthrobacter sp. KK5.5 TaxID=3373084 RepID=UPI003EE4F9A2
MQNGSPLVKVVAVWLAALMVVAVAAVVTVTMVNQRVFGPERLVTDYFALLQAGEGEQALGLVGAEVPPGNALLLDGEGLKASVAPITDFRVAGTSRLSGGHVEVTTTYSVNESDHQTVFRLRKSGSEWMFFDRWRFEAPHLPVLQVRADTTNEVRVNGLASPLSKGVQGVPTMLPSVVEASYETKYFEAPAKTRVVDAGPAAEREPLDLVTRPTERLVDEIDEQIRGYLDGCTAQQVLKPAACPLSYSTNARVSADTIKWDVVGYPKIDVEAYQGGWVLRPLEVDTRLTLVEQDLMTGAFQEKTVTESFGFTARLSVGPESVSVTPVTGE